MSIDFERRGAVALVTINRPDAMNALDVEHDRALADVWKEFEADETLLVGVLTGAGGRAFCSGGDLKTYMPWRRDVALHGTASTISFGGMTLADEITKPVIAAIQGHCIAGGLELAMACDVRICTADAKFGLAEVRWGVLPGGGGTQRLPRLVAVGCALEMILTGETIGAERAERIGLVNRIVSADTLLGEAFAIAERIAANGPLAVRAAKRAVQHGLDRSLADGLALEGELQKRLLQSADAEEGLRAFAERRRPVYTAAGARLKA
ncbi:enoyl-CoA hydratase/isomerase family protein [Bradyrhizobium tropiciagri]|uniref:enoyl-CoA hydratase/isomerase family protein n=1 Tax=Bradyrhizobium tropiciagri TaxID=312253 RepID=UPI001BA4CBA5|nr:enoyl-CoA hydratase-related protein [Bradyrhizobium tropiciagri]MBR0869420.1 enoyl-CoA hydratase/isomerase family protein [Bradyrhizobium tropiciagri]